MQTDKFNKMRKKSINDLVSQLNRTIFVKGLTAYHAYQRSFEKRFGFAPHSKECADFCKKHGKDFKV